MPMRYLESLLAEGGARGGSRESAGSSLNADLPDGRDNGRSL